MLTGMTPSMRRSIPLPLALLLALACAPADQAPDRDYLYLWTAAADTTQPDFLAVLDVTEDTGSYGRLVATLPVPGHGNGPHHTEHELAPDGQLFANGFATGQSFIFDLSTPEAPALAAQFGDVEGYSHPHSFLVLPNGNRLATFQMRHADGAMRTGGLVEMTPAGGVVRSASADFEGASPDLRVYSAGIVESLDRIVTTTTDMDRDTPAARNLQVWRLSDLTLLHTFPLADGPAGDEGSLTAEPRVLADGKTVLVSTFSCGLYLMEGLETDAPSARLVASYPRTPLTYCAIPVVAGNYYLMTVPALNAVVTLDVRNPAAPREVSRLVLGPDDVPHWIAISPDHRRVVVTGYGALRHRVLMARFDPRTGALSLDPRFREEGAAQPGFGMADRTWPHGATGSGVPHGAVFSRK